MKRKITQGDNKSTIKKSNSSSVTVFGSQEASVMDIDDPSFYIQHLQDSCAKGDYLASYILTDIGNRLLLTKLSRYSEIGDPLAFMLQKLYDDKTLYESAKLGSITATHLNTIQQLANNESLDKIIRKELQSMIEAQQEVETTLELQNIDDKLLDISAQLEHINLLFENRQNLNEKLQGAFPFAQRRLTKTFTSNYQKNVDNVKEQEIIGNLRTTLSILLDEDQHLGVNSYNDKIVKFFGVPVHKSGNGTRYLAKTTGPLKNKIEGVIGREPNQNDIIKYCKVHNIDINATNPEVIKTEVRDYITENEQNIYNTMQGVAAYMLYPDYLASLTKEDFLVQTLAYRQISRDLQKTVLVEGNAEQRNIPPGINSTIKITTGGSATLFLGELGSYKTIGENNTETLKNYKDFFCNGYSAVEKEEVFKTLHQIEAIRSSSALLTHAMFFELASENFMPKRLGPTANWQYDFAEISTQMPMAMKGAVSGAVLLNDAFEGKLSSNLPYDYRFQGDQKNAAVLDSKNSNILFDFLLWKSGVNYVFLEDLLNTDKTDEIKETPTEDGTIHFSKNIYSGEYNFTCEILPPLKAGENKDNHMFTDFVFTCVDSFPLNVFDELLNVWYGTAPDGLQDILNVHIKVMGGYFDYADSPEDS